MSAAPFLGQSTLGSSSTPEKGAHGHPSVVHLALQNKTALYRAYIPFFTQGGLFVPSTRNHRLGDDLYLMLTLPDDPYRYALTGKVAWITPPLAANNRAQGVGVRFASGEPAWALKKRVEELLDADQALDRPTHTI